MDENALNIIVFNHYMPKFPNSKTEVRNHDLQIIIIIWHINAELEKVLR
jgi:hypothetical protein